jgi:hypothetical protein
MLYDCRHTVRSLFGIGARSYFYVSLTKKFRPLTYYNLRARVSLVIVVSPLHRLEIPYCNQIDIPQIPENLAGCLITQANDPNIGFCYNVEEQGHFS